nr:hypothetical protein [Actinomycetota bacterium]
MRLRIRRALVAVTPPIVAHGVKRALVRLGLRPGAMPAPVAPSSLAETAAAERERPPDAEPPVETPLEPAAPTPAGPPEWEYVPEGFARMVAGWDGGTVGEAYAEKWPEWV